MGGGLGGVHFCCFWEVAGVWMFGVVDFWFKGGNEIILAEVLGVEVEVGGVVPYMHCQERKG